MSRWKKIDKLEGISRIMLLMIIGMCIGYTLVTLFGLIIGAILSSVLLWFFIRVMKSTLTTEDSSVLLGKKSTPTKIRYRCLACNNSYTDKRECPKCGSKMKQIEFY